MLIDDMSENEKVYHQLKNYYIEWIYKTSYITPILRAILTHTSLAARQPIPGTDILLEELSKLGLIKFVKEDESSDIGALTCPYIWLWLMANASDDNVLHHWNFKYYNELQHKEDPYIPPGCPYWMHFEHFVASFRVIKSKIFGKDQQIKLKDIYAGAKHNFGEEAIINKPLSLEAPPLHNEQARGRKITSEAIQPYKDKVRRLSIEKVPNQALILSINRYFVKLYIDSHQYKFLNSEKVSQNIYDDEHEKATDEGDVFVLVTCGSSDVNERAFLLVHGDQLNANEANFTEITSQG
ncbi:hypothetical protein RhiirC2_776047 [Rhizophagus irregularis]|uniref:Uncharacterized protein n=1 Tax=Rhizophagus irregularis TaxID=588596 RepID=A0A2N1NHW9_9GLOM|nr:hypothetical protein RhiirC2_776047 [Rhizophagus irregularis]